jgi:hypothetical protein
MATFVHAIASIWPFLIAVLGFVLGCLATRVILTPRYCPRCQYYLSWRLQTRAEAKGHKKEKEPWETN